MSRVVPPLPVVLHQRSTGEENRQVFLGRVGYLRQKGLSLITDIQISHPRKSGYVATLDIDRIEDRFLLAGGSDAIVCVYDLSPWGKQKDHFVGVENTNSFVYTPVGQSARASALQQDGAVPLGHAHSVVTAQWYPEDTGAFVSASAEGSILVWDTNNLTPVVRWKPLETLSCLDMSARSNLLAIGSERHTSVKLVDVKSGASSHELVGHNNGITVNKWSPACPTILASGSLDGSIRLWDIRKSGSNSCITTLNRDANVDTTVSNAYDPTYTHLLIRKSDKVAPNNYRHAESNAVTSHSGPISALSFTPDGHYLISTGRDGRLQQWDLRSGNLLSTRFASRPHEPAVGKRKRVSLIVTHGASPVAWVGHGSQVLGYLLERGGAPTQTLTGHLGDISCLTTQHGYMRIISAARDGMILIWGSQQSRKREGRNRISLTGFKRRREDVSEDKDNW